MEKLFIFLTALLLDLLIGEPPEMLHPVVYMGRIMMKIDKLLEKSSSRLTRFLAGIVGSLIEILIWVMLAVGVWKLKSQLIFMILSAYLLKASFAVRSLYEHVKKCETTDPKTLRKSVSLIVSRDVEKLDKAHLYSAAIESLAENINDSITAPLFYYVLLGLPGAILYRISNTLDALFGYRTVRYEWFGKFPAKLDDLLNFIPARITALIILAFNPKRSWRYIKKYGRIKLNSTYPMSAFAGVLGVKLEKIGYYSFEGKDPDLKDLKASLKLYKKVALIILILTGIVLLIEG